MKTDFGKKSQRIRRDQKISKMTEKWCWGFWQKCNPFIRTFLNFFQLSAKLHVWEKSGLKNLETNKNAGFFKPQYLIKELRYKIEFLKMLRHSCRSNIHTQSFQVGVVKRAWACLKWCQIVSQFYLKNRSYKFIQSFQVSGVVRHALIDLKQGVSYVSKKWT